jgi:hypothetical protein
VGWTRDARDRRVRLLDPMRLYVLRRPGPIDPAALEAIVEALEPGAKRSRRLGIIVAAITIPVIVVGLAASIAIEGRPALNDLILTVTNPAIIGAIVAGAVVPWISARHQRMKRVRSVMLAHGVCPHCGYGLTGVPRGDDSATVCPECACAWRLDRATTAVSATTSAAAARRQLAVLAVLTGLALLGIVALFVYLRATGAW